MAYEEFKKSPFWDVLEEAIYILEKNDDIELKTPDYIIIGSLVKIIEETISQNALNEINKNLIDLLKRVKSFNDQQAELTAKQMIEELSDYYNDLKK